MQSGPKFLQQDYNKNEGLKVRHLTTADIPSLTCLRSDVLGALADAELYSRETDEVGFMRAHIGETGSGETLGVFDGRELIAYGMIGFPDKDDPTSFGRYIWTDPADLARTAELASCMVSARYRGRHLQRLLLAKRIELAQSRGRHLCVAMASLRNHVSRHNLMREGLQIGWVGEICGLRRHLLTMDLSKPRALDLGVTQWVDAADWKRQQHLVQNGWWGVDSVQLPQEGSTLLFAR